MSNSILLKPQPNSRALAVGSVAATGIVLSSKLGRHLTQKHAHYRSTQQYGSLFNSVWIGAASGMIGISAVYPVDVVKTRLQNAAIGTTISASQLLQTIVRVEGYGALYKGLIPQLCGTGPDKAISLGTRALISRMHSDPTSLFAIMTAAAGAGAVQSTVMSPVEIVKVRMQLDSTQSMGSIIRSLGTRGLYRGFSACFLRDVAFSTTYFTLYDITKQKLKIKDGSSIALSLAAGVASGIPAAFLTTPLDVVKTKMQADAIGGKSILRVCREVAQTEGLEGFFKGWAPRVSRIAPQFGIVLVSFDFLNSRFG